MGSQQSLYALSNSRHEIRLLHIQPGPWSFPILCSLQTVSLDTSPTYQALSYTWGDPTPTRFILVEDVVLEVRINLYHALRRLRCTNNPRVIWIDAICINQSDMDERTQQVMLMKSVYSNCREVMMWLGDGVPILDQSNTKAYVYENANDNLTIEEGRYKLVEYYASQLSSFSYPALAGRKGYEIHDAFIIILLLGRDIHLQEQPYFQLENSGLTSLAALRFRNAL